MVLRHLQRCPNLLCFNSRISRFSISYLNTTLQARCLSGTVSLSPPVEPPPALPENSPLKHFDKDKPETTIYSSLNNAEIAKFAAIAETWWDAEGPYKPLHSLNPMRVSFIRSSLCRHFRKDPHCTRPLEGLRIIDVGCGGGILSEERLTGSLFWIWLSKSSVSKLYFLISIVLIKLRMPSE